MSSFGSVSVVVERVPSLVRVDRSALGTGTGGGGTGPGVPGETSGRETHGAGEGLSGR